MTFSGNRPKGRNWTIFELHWKLEDRGGGYGPYPVLLDGQPEMGGTIQIRQGRWLVIIYRLDKRSRMNREIHVWMWERGGEIPLRHPTMH